MVHQALLWLRDECPDDSAPAVLHYDSEQPGGTVTSGRALNVVRYGRYGPYSMVYVTFFSLRYAANIVLGRNRAHKRLGVSIGLDTNLLPSITTMPYVVLQLCQCTGWSRGTWSLPGNCKKSMLK